jgi:uncharacterized protein with beta-barrel porin domain
LIADKVTVRRNANVSGGTVDVGFADGETLADFTAPQYRYEIFAAKNMNDTRFTGVSGLMTTDFYTDIAYTNASATLYLINKKFSFSTGNENSRAVGLMFDNIFDEGQGADYGVYRELLGAVRGLDTSVRENIQTELAGSSAANSLMIGQWEFARPVLDRLQMENVAWRRSINNHVSFWVDTIYQEAITGDGDPNSYGYTIQRPGLVLGADMFFGSTNVGGLAFGYSNPVMTNHNDRVTAHDFQVGAYYIGVLPADVELKAYGGFGCQNYESRRTTTVGDEVSSLTSSFSGASVIASAEGSRLFGFGKFTTIRPFIAADVVISSQNAHTEEGFTLVAGDYEKNSYGRALGRMGARIRYENNFSSLWMQGSYAMQLFGKGTPEAKVRFVAAPNEEAMTIYGVNNGVHYLDFGFGGNIYLNRQGTRRLTASYDLTIGKRLKIHTGSFGFVQIF